MNALYNEPNHSSYGRMDVLEASDGVLTAPTEERTAPFPENAPSRKGSAPPDVFRHEDYREFLKARFAELQSQDPAFSQRGLARRAGIANPGFFNEVIKGRRRLSPVAAMKMSNGLELTEEQSEYFSVLVEFSETREPRAKFAAGARLIAMRNRRFQDPVNGPAPADGLQDKMRGLEGEWALRIANPVHRDVQPLPGITDK